MNIPFKHYGCLLYHLTCSRCWQPLAVSNLTQQEPGKYTCDAQCINLNCSEGGEEYFISDFPIGLIELEKKKKMIV